MFPSSSNLRLASRKRRFAAFVIDHFLFTVILVSFIFLVIGTDFTNKEDTAKSAISILASASVGILIYLFKDCIKGNSPGKWMLGIAVRDEHDPHHIPAYYKLFLRNVFLLIRPLEAIILASSNEKKRLGDKATNAIVVQQNKKPKLLPIISIIVVTFISFFTFIIFFIAGALKNSDSYKISIAEIEQNKAIIEETGGIVEYGMFPSGSISTRNGEGEADLKISVKGKLKDVKVRVNLTKSAEENWKVVNIEYHPEN